MHLIRALRDHGSRDLTIIGNTAGIGVVFGARREATRIDPGILVANEQVSRVIASYPIAPAAPQPNPLEEGVKSGAIQLETNPQGILAERIRAGGAGIPAFWSPVGIGTVVEEGKEKRVIDGVEYILEWAIRADFALVRAYKADRTGNLIYRGNTRHLNVSMATAAEVTIAEVDGPDDLSRQLLGLLGRSDILPGTDDSSIHNADNLKTILLSSYSGNKVLIGPSAPFIDAGSLSTTYSSPQDMARSVAYLLEQGLPPQTTSYPRYFSVLSNAQVARSLGIPLPDDATLARRLAELEQEP